ncbi:MAG: cobalamin-dependent protein [Chloroflexota bacterium]
MPAKKPIRVLMAKTSLDGHWRGIYVVTMALRDAGMEVIWGGEIDPYQIAQTAIQEDVDVIGLNVCGRYYQIQLVMEQLKEKGAGDILVVAGGIIPPNDVPEVQQMGVAGVFPPGSTLASIVNFIKDNVKPKKNLMRA